MRRQLPPHHVMNNGGDHQTVYPDPAVAQSPHRRTMLGPTHCVWLPGYVHHTASSYHIVTTTPYLPATRHSPYSEASDGPVRVAPQGDVSDVAHTADKPNSTRTPLCAIAVRGCALHTTHTPGCHRVTHGSVTVCVMSDMSPCGAPRTRRSGASVRGGIAVRGFDGCGLAGAVHECLA